MGAMLILSSQVYLLNNEKKGEKKFILLNLTIFNNLCDIIPSRETSLWQSYLFKHITNPKDYCKKYLNFAD